MARSDRALGQRGRFCENSSGASEAVKGRDEDELTAPAARDEDARGPQATFCGGAGAKVGGSLSPFSGETCLLS